MAQKRNEYACEAGTGIHSVDPDHGSLPVLVPAPVYQHDEIALGAEQGFSIVPSTYLFANIKKLIAMGERLPILTGLWNSLLVAGLSAALCTYFSVMTAYAIHAYDFKLKNSCLRSS